MNSERFAMIREPEAEALKGLSSNAAKALIAIKFGRRAGEEIAFGVRDLEEWGLSRGVAARALAQLVEAGLLEIAADSTFGAKRRRRVFRATHARPPAALQSHRRDTGKPYSPTGETMAPSTVSPAGLSDRLQSHRRDITRTPFLPSVGREGGREDRLSEAIAEPKPDPSPPRDGPRLGEGERAVRAVLDPPTPPPARRALMEQQQRIDAAARALGMTSVEFMRLTGGPTPAGALAQGFECGDLDCDGLVAMIEEIGGRMLTPEQTRALVYRAVARASHPDRRAKEAAA